MNKPQRSTISDLTALGGELAEEHLSLASGGRRPLCNKLDCTRMSDGTLICQIDPDL